MASTLATVLVAFSAPFFVIGVVGNIAIILCVLATPSLRTRTNAINVSLTSSCLAFLLSVVPFTMDSFLKSSWRFALWYCHTAAYLAFGFIGVTMSNITILSLYRYFCVVHPTKLFLRGIPALVLLISTSWLLPFLVQVYIAAFRIAHTEYVPMYARCVVIKSGNSTVYNGMIFGATIPTLAITLFSYAGIYVHVKKSANRLRQRAILAARPTSQSDVQIGQISKTDEGDQTPKPSKGDSVKQDFERARGPRPAPKNGAANRNAKEQHYLTKFCVVVFALFLVCYGPIVILTAVYSNENFPADAYTVCTVIYWLGSCLHPLVYAALQPQIQRSALRFLRRCCLTTHHHQARINPSSHITAREQETYEL